jgi:hypothetical protein
MCRLSLNNGLTELNEHNYNEGHLRVGNLNIRGATRKISLVE